MNMLTLDLTSEELEQLKTAVERSFKDAGYHNRHSEEKYAKSLMSKIAIALRKEQDIDSNELFGHGFDYLDEEYLI